MTRAFAIQDRARQCDGKRTFTKKEAKRRLSRGRGEWRKNMQIYKCPHCSPPDGPAIWHLGHNTPLVRKEPTMTTHEGVERPTGARVEGPIKASDGQWFWRRIDANGEKVAGPVEMVEHRQHAQEQAIQEAEAFGLRLFHPGFDSDGTEDAEHWVEVDFRARG